jgi:hypothetical protein
MLACAALSTAAKSPPEPPGELLASVEMVEGWKPVERRTGWWFYAQKIHPDLAAPSVTGYEYSNGKLVREFGGGTEADLYDAIRQAKLEQFDMEQETEAASNRMIEASGAELFICGARDGARYRITFVTAAGRFQYELWNPDNTINCLAPASERLARLKVLLDLLRKFYADSRLWS